MTPAGANCTLYLYSRGSQLLSQFGSWLDLSACKGWVVRGTLPLITSCIPTGLLPLGSVMSASVLRGPECECVSAFVSASPRGAARAAGSRARATGPAGLAVQPHPTTKRRLHVVARGLPIRRRRTQRAASGPSTFVWPNQLIAGAGRSRNADGSPAKPAQRLLENICACRSTMGVTGAGGCQPPAPKPAGTWHRGAPHGDALFGKRPPQPAPTSPNPSPDPRPDFPAPGILDPLWATPEIFVSDEVLGGVGLPGRACFLSARGSTANLGGL